MQQLQNKKPLSGNNWAQLEPWLKLSLISGVGPLRLQKLLSHFETPERILSATVKELAHGIPEKVAEAIVEQQHSREIFKKLDIARGWQDASEAHHILCPDSDFYPVQLKELPDPPAVLYVIGSPVLLSEPQVSIVGSRRPTPQGPKNSRGNRRAVSSKWFCYNQRYGNGD